MKKHYFFLFLILLGALYVRLEGIGWGLPEKTLSLTSYHPDEAYLFHALEHMKATHSLHPGRMGLLYGTLHFYLAGFFILMAKILGYLDFGSREFLLQNLSLANKLYMAPRILSVLCGVVSVAGVYYLGRRLYHPTLGLLSAFFLSFYPAAIAVSHYAKVDALLAPLVLCLLIFCLDLLENPQFKNAGKCGFITGLLASTKYNAGIFLLLPLSLIALKFFKNSEIKQREGIYLVLGIILFAGIGFVLTTPYAIMDFPLFFNCLTTQFSLAVGTGVWEVATPYPFWRYVYFYLPFGIGWVSLILFLAVLPWLLLRLGEKEILLFLGFLFYFLLISFSRQKLVSYTAPLLPLIAIFSGVALTVLTSVFRGASLRIMLVAIVLICHAFYGFCFSQLYSKVNSREQASMWLKENVPTENSIGIVRSYYWTPGLLRREHSPYPLIKAGGDQWSLEDSILGLSSIQKLPNFFVVSELEIREYFRLESSMPKYAKTVRNFLSNYEELKSFELKPQFLGVSLWKRTPPWDFSMISPTIKIYKKKA